MTFEIIEITPQMASEMLAHNEGNRHINPARVNQYAADMLRGAFESLDPIAISEDGKLLNGQHRLKAIIAAGIPVKMLVAKDVRSTMVFDKGQTRSTADSLKMSGLISAPITKNQIGAINCYLDIAIGHYNITDIVRADFINSHEYEITLLKRLSSKGAKQNRYIRLSAFLGGCLAAILNGVSFEKIEEFCDIVGNGFATRSDQSAAIVMRNYLISIIKFNGGINRQTCAFTQMAIRDFVAGYPRKKSYTNLEHCYIKNIKENTK